MTWNCKMDYATDEEDVNPQFNRGLEHVFTLLALTLDPDAVRLSMQAAFSKDMNLRGTALEYLSAVLLATTGDCSALWQLVPSAYIVHLTAVGGLACVHLPEHSSPGRSICTG